MIDCKRLPKPLIRYASSRSWHAETATVLLALLRAASGHAAALPAPAMNSRLRILIVS
jgi:hypothetical protein